MTEQKSEFFYISSRQKKYDLRERCVKYNFSVVIISIKHYLGFVLTCHYCTPLWKNSEEHLTLALIPVF